MNQPLVSVIIPIKNRVNILERAVKSVANQTYPNIELIIVDDGSEENVEEKVEEIKNSGFPFKIIFLKQLNTGPGIARRNGLYKSNGKYIQYLDSDDEILPAKIENQVALLSENPDAVMVYGNSMQNGDPNRLHRKSFHKKPVDDLLQCALQKRKWHTSACLWNYGQIGEYWDNLKNGEDVLHDVTVGAKVGRKILYSNEIVCNINFDPKDASHLSNYHIDQERLHQIVANATKLNDESYRRIKESGLTNSRYVEPLSERYFYEAIKFAIFNYVPESIYMLKRGRKLTKSIIKKLEITTAIFIITKLNNNIQLIKALFRLHTIILPSKIHQFRRFASLGMLCFLFQNI